MQVLKRIMMNENQDTDELSGIGNHIVYSIAFILGGVFSIANRGGVIGARMTGNIGGIGAIPGAAIGFVISPLVMTIDGLIQLIRHVFWGGGLAACNGCGQEVDRKLATCPNCGALVKATQ